MSLLEHPVWKRLRPLPWIGAAALLMLPLVAMRFTDEVQWSGVDVLVMALLLAAVCAAFELGLRKAPNSTCMLATGMAVGTGFLLAWVTLAVGIIGNENEPANLMFFGVLAIGLVAVIRSGLQPRRLAMAALVVAVAQLAATAATAVLAEGPVFLLSAIFAVLWLIAAWLFALSARQAAEA